MDFKAIAASLISVVTAVAGALATVGFVVPDTFVASTQGLINGVAGIGAMIVAFLPGLWAEIQKVFGEVQE